MTYKYTKKDMEKSFERLMGTFNKEKAVWKQVNGKNKIKIGSWNLDVNNIYGGGVVEEMATEGGGVRHPFGEGRMKPREFVETTRRIAMGVEMRERQLKKQLRKKIGKY